MARNCVQPITKHSVQGGIHHIDGPPSCPPSTGASMNRVGSRLFREVWLVDFEFCAPAGENPIPICLVAWELGSGRKLRLWEEDMRNLHAPPYPTDRDCLVVAYYASAEMGCHLALDWPIPVNLLDLYVEFRNLTNGRPSLCGDGLLGALAWFGLPAIEAVQKESMRALAERGGPWTNAEKLALLEYCESDVVALSQLLPAMEPYLDVDRALNRGRYMKSAAHIEHHGVPIDTALLRRLREDWTSIQDQLIAEIDQD